MGLAVCVTIGPQDRDTEEDAQVYPMTPGSHRPSKGGGGNQSCHDRIVSSEKVLPGLAKIRNDLPSTTIIVDELGSRTPRVPQRSPNDHKASWNIKLVMP